jgi:hypothetical protein
MEESDICPPWALTPPPPPPPYQGAQILANFFLKLHLTMMYHCAKYEVKVHDGVGQQDSRYPLPPPLNAACVQAAAAGGMQDTTTEHASERDCYAGVPLMQVRQ